ncbi:MAG: hypothetical protein H0V14_11600, partial [Chitinophagaceae bacterium]|nr:hypothetical protein [Chitinophagaceae bacterium]
MKRLIILMLLVVSSTAIFAQEDGQLKHKKKHTSTAMAKYTCPMHPEVISTKPGKCPQCGTQFVVTRTGSKQVQKITYSCPMHPDVVSDTMGKCPKCNMDLTLSKKEQMKKDGMKLYS